MERKREKRTRGLWDPEWKNESKVNMKDRTGRRERAEFRWR